MSAGIPRISKKKALFAAATATLASLGSVKAATVTWNGGGTDNNFSTVFNWVGTVAPVNNDALVFDGFSRLAPANDLAPNTTFSGITFASTAGGFTVSGNAITLGGDITDNATVLTETISLNQILNATRNISVADNAFLRLTGVISDGGGGFGLNKTGNGAVSLAGTNTFSGPVTVTGGSVYIATDANLGAVPGAATAGKIVINGGSTLGITGSVAISSNRGMMIGPTGASGSGVIDVGTGITATYGGIIANNTGGTGGLTKLSFGSLTVSGANTYTGPTAIKNGTLLLNFAGAGAPASNIINGASSLTLGGANAGLGQDSFAALTMTGKGTATSTQSFSGTTIDV